jgi:dephospho-CoA kinase
MLRIGLTGGVGAGKSTVSATFDECGAVVVDGDVIAREVVEPGTEGLAALVEAFGPEILLPDGGLNRPALAAVAFADDDKRATLNGIVHPLVGRRRAELIEHATASETNPVIVEDIPLLVESQLAPFFPLVIVVHAEVATRIARLTEQRGMPESDARSRIAAQAGEEQRRAVADVWLDNSGTQEEIIEQARNLWDQRITPFAANIGARRPAPAPSGTVDADPTWPQQGQRIVARIRAACGQGAVRVDHIGPTAVPGLDAEDVIDIQVTVESLAVADELAAPLLEAGYPRLDDVTADAPDTDGDPQPWQKRYHASADPGRAVRVHLRVDGRPNQRFGLVFADWLADDAGARAAYLDAERDGTEQRWLRGASRRAWHWAEATGWGR